MNEVAKKFGLLFWKNCILQKRHKIQTVAEILIPLIFTLIFVLIRGVLDMKVYSEPTIYTEFDPFLDVRGTAVPGGKYILYAPSTPEVVELMKLVEGKFKVALKSQSTNYQFVACPNEKELERKYESYGQKKILAVSIIPDKENENPVLAAIVFKDLESVNIKYELRFPASLHDPTKHATLGTIGQKPRWLTEFLYEFFPLPHDREHVDPLQVKKPEDLLLRLYKARGGRPGYWAEGFLFLQTTLDTEIARKKAQEHGKSDDILNDFKVKLNRFPYPKYVEDRFIAVLQIEFPFFLMLSYIYSNVNIAKSIAHEKERRLKESMKIMGLPNWLHWTAWFTKSYLFLLISTIIITIFYKIPWYENKLAVLTYADATLLFFFFLSYVFATITLGFLFSTFFSTANSAATASGVCFFLTFVPFWFFRPRYNQLSLGMKMSMSIFSNLGMALGCQLIAVYEGTGAGIQWQTISHSVSPDEDLTLLHVIIMLVLDGFLYLLLAIYIEAVFPGEYGVPLKWYFPFTKWYWFGGTDRVAPAPVSSEDSFQTASQNPSLFETEPKGFAGIRIAGLTKVFGNNTAVNNIWINFYENQVTALLGHNGAGKTTTMSILTGLFPPTSGTAIVNGFDIRNDIKSVRGSLGLCPQHDVLFDEMTVQEHLRFFCKLKGLGNEFVEEEINRMLKIMTLENKRHAQSHTLSGGMKRKLSVGIALIGGSKVVLLDEPTSGMDPGARRSTWDLITSEKKGRTIVLSTHFMDEADILGDRIAIMAEGQVRCCGSSLFLKKKYGGGYHLIIVKDDICKVDRITELLRLRIPEVHIDQNIGAELSYSLPDEKSFLFPEMFEELEKRKNELGIASYGCSITQMEEVFMRVGKSVEDEMLLKNTSGLVIHDSGIFASTNDSLVTYANENIVESYTSAISDNHEGVDENDHIFISTNHNVVNETHRPEATETRNDGLHLLLQQFWGMLVKKWLYTNRHWFLVTSQMLIPVVFLVIALITVKTLPDVSVPSERVMDLRQYAPYDKPITTIQCENEKSGVCLSYNRLASKKSVAKIVKDFEQFILQESTEDLPLVNAKYIVGLKATNSDKNLIGYFNNKPFHSPPLSLNLISNAILRRVTGNESLTLTVSNHPLPFKASDKVENLIETESEGLTIGLNISFGMSFLVAYFVVFIVKERETKSKHLQFVSGVRFQIFWLSHFLFDAAIFIIATFLMMLTLLIFQAKDFTNENSAMQGYFFILLMCYGWGVIPLMYVFSFLVTVPSGGYTKMALFNLVSGMATFLTIAILQLKSLKKKDLADSLEWLFMIFPNFDLGYSIGILSLNRELHTTCPKVLETLEARLSASRLNASALPLVPRNLTDFCHLFPEFECCDLYPNDYLGWKEPGIGRHLFYLLVVGTLSFIALFLIESNILQKLRYQMEKQKYASLVLDDDPTILEDDDVAEENERMRNTDMTELFQSNNVVLKNLTKYYGGFLAVDRICLGVQHGQCFGLLGVNGAGKTTTFKMLTGEIPITSGHAYIARKSVKSEIKQIQKVIGYCPQFDALIPELTGRETIRMFARLRGIQEHTIDKLVDRLGEDLLFTKHMDKPCGTYSGGNKRKLSTAIALVGNPPLLLMDEPTTGMDPVARRHLWNTIIKVREGGASVILTSHSMEECEALCTRLAIMVNGKFRCLGSSQHLKNKFGDGYTLIAQLEAPFDDKEHVLTRTSIERGRHSFSVDKKEDWEYELQPLRSFIEDNFPGCELKEVHPGYVHYHINVGEEVSWGILFRKMEEAKRKFSLEAYSVGQTTLEQVFLSFTKAQINND